MNKTQLQTTFAPLIAAIAGFLAGKGYFGFDAQTWISIIGAIAALGATVWGAVAARPQALKDTTGGLPNTTVVTDKSSADALPNNPDVVAVTPEIATAIKKAS
jgi:hypothetical protein